MYQQPMESIRIANHPAPTITFNLHTASRSTRAPRSWLVWGRLCRRIPSTRSISSNGSPTTACLDQLELLYSLRRRHLSPVCKYCDDVDGEARLFSAKRVRTINQLHAIASKRTCMFHVLSRSTVFFCRASAARLHSAAYAVVRCLSLLLSVCHVRVLYQNEKSYPQTFFIVG